MPETPSIVELLERLMVVEAENRRLAEENQRQAADIRRLAEENAELRRRLGQNPRNSDRPPSSEGLAKPTPKSLRGKSGRKPGGQPGHQGRTLRQVDRPDVVVRHEPEACSSCGDSLTEAAETGVTRRQVFEIPPIRTQVTEHQLVTRQCACGQHTTGVAPATADAPVQYGPRLTAIMVYLMVVQFGAQKRVADAVADLFGVPVSQGTVAALTARSAKRLEGDFLGWLRQALAERDLVHFDETGLRVDGALHWVHCATSGKYTLVYVHRNRGRKGIDAGGILPGFTGFAVHDAWAPYDCYTEANHVLCCAHLLRELIAATETGQANLWAQQAITALLTLKHAADTAMATGAVGIDTVVLAEQETLFRQAALVAIKRPHWTDHQGRQETGRPGPTDARQDRRLPAFRLWGVDP